MSGIEELIRQHCPDGVKCKTILEVLAQPITDGPHETPKLQPEGIPFISVEAIHDGIVDISKCRGFISPEYSEICRKKYKPAFGDVYMVKAASVGRVAIVDRTIDFDIWSPIAAMRPNQNVIVPKYLFYALQTPGIQSEVLMKSSKGSQPNLSMRKLEKFKIPVPPIEVQEEIVRILDAMCALEAKLKEELEAREKQASYYFNEITSCSYEKKGLVEICRSIKTGKLNANAAVENGAYPFFTCDSKPFKIDTYAFDAEAIIVSGNGSQIGHVNYYKGKFNAYQRTYVLSEFNDVVPSYLYLYLKRNIREYILRHAKTGSVPYITLPILEKFPVPAPPVETQREIAAKLDAFEALIQNLHDEIAARHTQYEHYRDMLLAFDRAA